MVHSTISGRSGTKKVGAEGERTEKENVNFFWLYFILKQVFNFFFKE